MRDMDISSHFVCTLREAKTLIDKHAQFWISSCWCRENMESIENSRPDVCIVFTPDSIGTDSNVREVDKDFVCDILEETKSKHLVSTLFYGKAGSQQIQGVCICRSFFENPNKISEKGNFIEETDINACIACGTCVDVCYFKAREIRDGELVDHREQCYGCGLCVDVCPMHCITMSPRQHNKR